ncbi:glycosyl transferase [Cellulomonas rhizosphaerae]|uniref:Glycosyl transferase n=1 Tax=Cellulomonas rhizosphaerae TaxID=2293719 RepID=A0A413RJU0_9CELL|nr:glycosyl transferase [Cellulomonas rhizosphaerae]
MLRRLGAVPAGAPDGIGEDAALIGALWHERVLVYFPEPPTNLYQLAQWLEPLEALAGATPVRVVVQDSRVARTLRARTALPVSVVARSATLDDMLSRADVALFLYVSHHPGNFQALRVRDVAHVYLTHGDSDKAVSISNQLKAYDFTFVPGRAAVDRTRGRLLWFDADERMVPVGRPQLDGLHGATRDGAGVPTVLYAPTWEGAQPSTAYSSLADRGTAIVRSLLADGDLRVVYRPHPRTGARDASFADADAAVRALVRAAGQTVDETESVLDTMSAADVLVCDVSAMALDWLATGRPLVVTRPGGGAADVAATPLLDVVPRLGPDEGLRAADVVREQLASDPAGAARRALAESYLGESATGPATARFVDACLQVVARRDGAVAAPGDAS